VRIATAQLSGTGTVLETISTDLRLNGGLTLATSGSSGSFHNLLLSGNLSNAGVANTNVTIASAGGSQVILSGNNTNFGVYTVNNGAILTTLGTSALNSQTLTNNGTVNVNGGQLLAGPLSGSGVITTSTTGLQDLLVSNTNSTTFSGSILDGSGTLALTKNGSGNLTLTGSSNYTGDTTVNAGSIGVAATASINAASKVKINGGALNYGKSGSEPPKQTRLSKNMNF
jgi:autotransporter-associated beta strand protein